MTTPLPGRARRLGVIASLYLVSDVGFSFFLIGLTVILLQLQVPASRVGLISLLGTVYFARFVLGPLVDRFGLRRFGRYRGWLIGTQVVLVALLAAAAALDPLRHLGALLVTMTLVLLVSALHDTATNGLTVVLLPRTERGAANGIQVGAASVSILIGSGGALLFYATAGWAVTLLVLAAVYLVPLVVLARFQEPDVAAPRERAAVLRELVAFFRAPHRLCWMAAVEPLFVLGIFLASAVQPALLLRAGWSVERIGLIQQTLAPLLGMLGALAAGVLIGRTARHRSALVLGVGAAVAITLMLPLALGSHTAVVDVVGVVALSTAYSSCSAWLYTVSMDLTRPSNAATDYSMQLAVVGLLRVVLGAAGLILVDAVGFGAVTVTAVVLALLGAGLAWRWARWSHPAAEDADGADQGANAARPAATTVRRPGPSGE